MSNPVPADVRLDFDRLVREYLDNLQVNLRGFQAAESVGFLDAWVPHDDPTENLLDLLELARDAGVPRLTIELDETTATHLDMPYIAAAAGAPTRRGGFHRCELTFDLEALPNVARPARAIEVASSPTVPSPTVAHELPRTTVTASSESRTTPGIHRCYQAALDRVLGDVRHRRRPDPVPGMVEVAVHQGGWELIALVQLKSTVVHHAGFLGDGSLVEQGLLEMLCREMEGRLIQECADHAAIAVEYALRDRNQLPPVFGVVTPDNADPAFQLPQQIVRRLLAEYRAQTGYTATQNFFDRPPSPCWMKLSDAERRAAIEQALASGDVAGQVELVRMDGLKRVVVRFTSTLPSDRQQGLLAQLEIDLHQSVESTLQLTTQVRADANILRMPEKKG